MKKQTTFSFQTVLAACLVFLWVYTALSKLLQLDTSLFFLRQSPWVAPFAKPLSILLPLAELVVAGLLLRQHSRRFGLQLSLVLLIVFSGYILLMLISKSNLPCTCGGIISRLSWKQHLLLNTALIAVCVRGLFNPQQTPLPSPPGPSTQPG